MLLIAHVAISLIAIVAGLVVVYGLVTAQRLDRWTSLFLWTTIATSVTGFPLPADQILPSHIVGAISLVVLTIAVVARYVRRLANGWRAAYVVTAVLALYLNVFVLVVQLFRRVPALNTLAPTQAEPPFAIAQLAVLLLFVGLGIVALKKFRGEAIGVAAGGARGSSPLSV
jgi:hypothetical protein